MIGELSDHISGTPKISKYDDPGNPIVTVVIDKVAIGNTLIDLGAAINMMTTTALAALKLERFLHPTPTVLELADHTTVKPAGMLDDIIVTVASWEYPVDFMVINAKYPSRGHPIILGRPWFATANAFIGCWHGEMTISNGLSS